MIAACPVNLGDIYLLVFMLAFLALLGFMIWVLRP